MFPTVRFCFHQKERTFQQGDRSKSVTDINHFYSPLYSVSFAFLNHSDLSAASPPCLCCQCLHTKPGSAYALTLFRVWLTKDTVLNKGY